MYTTSWYEMYLDFNEMYVVWKYIFDLYLKEYFENIKNIQEV